MCAFDASSQKGSDGRGLLTQEDKMRLITQFELATKSTSELHGMLRACFNELVMSSPDSHQHRNALASIKNIQQELGMR